MQKRLIMEKSWQARLRAALDADERSDRQVSLDAGLSPGYIHTLFPRRGKQGANPTIDKLAAICDALRISKNWVFFGVELTYEDEALLKEWAQLPPESRAAYLQIWRGQRQ